MAVRVAEYLGISVDSRISINPVPISKDNRPKLPCPFRNGICDKAIRGNKPVCSVRNGAGELWIVCAHRLCATQPKKSALTAYQAQILLQVAQCIYGSHIRLEDVLFKREVPIVATDQSNYSADYIMGLKAPQQSELPVVLEIQGGGETTNTGQLSSHITEWEAMDNPTNAILATQVSSVGTLETNAWRRQQEQFLVKGNVAIQSRGKMVFCVGSLIYDYLMPKFQQVRLNDLRAANWTLALLAFREKPLDAGELHETRTSIPLEIDPAKTLFTSYHSFVQALTNQSTPDHTIFSGLFTSLTGELVEKN